MKIFRNIPNGFKLFRTVGVLNYYQKDILALKDAGEKEKERELIALSTGKWADKVIKTFDITVNVRGRENLPESGPCVYISNHEGYGDIPVMFKALEGRQIGFVAKDTLEKVPYFGKWIAAIHGVFIKRGETREALKSMQEGVHLLKDGYSLVIFPEGTRHHTAGMGTFKPGAFKLAVKSKAPIVPISINGTRHLFEDRDVITSGAVVDVVIHPPVATEGLDRHELTNIPHIVEDTIRTTLMSLIEEEKIRTQKEE